MISWPLFGKIMFQLNNYCKYLISFFKSSWVFFIFFIVLLSFMGWLILFKKTYAYWFVLYLTLCFFFGLLTNGTPLNKLRWWHQKVTKHFDHVWWAYFHSTFSNLILLDLGKFSRNMIRYWTFTRLFSLKSL